MVEKDEGREEGGWIFMTGDCCVVVVASSSLLVASCSLSCAWGRCSLHAGEKTDTTLLCEFPEIRR